LHDTEKTIIIGEWV